MMMASRISLVKPSAALLARPARAGARRAVAVSPRASAEEEAKTELPTGETVFYKGNTFEGEEQFKEAVANGTASIPAASEPVPAASTAPLGFGELMAFGGPAPELINSRLAMLGLIAAIGAELSSGESVLRQWGDQPVPILLTFITFSIASLIPMFSSSKREAFGPFSPNAEIVNGRAAMLGFASLIGIELVTKTALF